MLFFKKIVSAFETKEVYISFVRAIFIGIIGYMLMYIIVSGSALITILPLKLLHFMPTKSSILNYGFIYVVVIGPIIEELIFRLPLKLNANRLIISMTLLSYCLVKSPLLEKIISALIVFIIISIYFRKKDAKLKIIGYKFRFGIVCISSIAFGFVHIFNFHFSSLLQCLLSPLIVFPQIIMGFCLSYVRLKYDKGLFIAILMHILLNGGAMLLESLKF